MDVLLVAAVLFFIPAYGDRHEMRGGKCDHLDSCQVKDFRTCSCEEDCYKYAICCFDAESFPLMADEKPEFQCHERHTRTPVFVKRTCAGQSHHEVCARGSSDTSFQFNHFLVSSSETHVTYPSKDCALCNHEDETSLIPWTSQLTCPTQFVSINNSILSITKKDMATYLTFDRNQHAWGLSVRNEFINCSINLYRPTQLINQLHYCAPNMISNCPLHYEDTEMAKLCAEHHGERKHKKLNLYYKNEHCASCHGTPLRQLDCVGRNYGQLPQQSGHDIVRAIFENWNWTEISGSEKYQCHYVFSSGLHCEKTLPQTNLLVNTAHGSGVHLLIPMFVLLCHVCFRVIL